MKIHRPTEEAGQSVWELYWLLSAYAAVIVHSTLKNHDIVCSQLGCMKEKIIEKSLPSLKVHVTSSRRILGWSLWYILGLTDYCRSITSMNKTSSNECVN